MNQLQLVSEIFTCCAHFSDLEGLATRLVAVQLHHPLCTSCCGVLLHSVTLQVYSYDFELVLTPVRIYKLVAGATTALLMDRLVFVISQDDEDTPCSVGVCN